MLRKCKVLPIEIYTSSIWADGEIWEVWEFEQEICGVGELFDGVCKRRK